MSRFVNKTAVHLRSVFEDFRILVFCCQLQLFLPLHVAVSSHHTQVASVDRQQHHRAGEGSIADVSQTLSRQHDEDPEGTRTGILHLKSQMYFFYYTKIQINIAKSC